MRDEYFRTRVALVMRMSIGCKKRQKYLYAISAAVLLVGMCCAVHMYLSVPYPSDTIVEQEPTKISSWFAGLCEGESLAYTIGCLTIAVSYALFCLGYMSGSGYNRIGTDVSSPDGDDTIAKKNHDKMA